MNISYAAILALISELVIENAKLRDELKRLIEEREKKAVHDEGLYQDS